MFPTLGTVSRMRRIQKYLQVQGVSTQASPIGLWDKCSVYPTPRGQVASQGNVGSGRKDSAVLDRLDRQRAARSSRFVRD